MNVGNRFARIENNTVGYGEITVNLLRMGENDKLEGTLLVKKGRLQRKIKVITVKTQSSNLHGWERRFTATISAST